jgi:hypothetical protein
MSRRPFFDNRAQSVLHLLAGRVGGFAQIGLASYVAGEVDQSQHRVQNVEFIWSLSAVIGDRVQEVYGGLML